VNSLQNNFASVPYVIHKTIYSKIVQFHKPHLS